MKTRKVPVIEMKPRNKKRITALVIVILLVLAMVLGAGAAFTVRGGTADAEKAEGRLMTHQSSR